MLSEKKLLTLEAIEAESALELPSRETLQLVNVVITNLLNNNRVAVAIPIQAAANICGVAVNVLSSQLAGGPVTCTAGANQTFTVTP